MNFTEDRALTEIIRDHIEINESMFDAIIRFVKGNFDLDDVFDQEDIEKYVTATPPEDWYPVEDLEEWAENNGYVKEPH